MATVTKADGTGFREFVLLFQNFVNLRYGDGSAIPNTAMAEDPEDSGQKGFNYRTEPMWFRFGYPADQPLTITRQRTDLNQALSNSLVGGDPETPVFKARAGKDVRFRVVHPGGNQRNNVFAVHGHVWEKEPYIHNSTELGDNPFSMYEGCTDGLRSHLSRRSVAQERRRRRLRGHRGLPVPGPGELPVRRRPVGDLPGHPVIS